MRKKKILIQTNGIHMKTGLAEAGRALSFYLHKTGKYEIVYYATQCNVADPALGMMPFKTYGALPNDPQTVNQLNQNPGLARDVAYGSHYIDEIIKNEKPDAVVFADDLWSFPLNHYAQKKWHSKLHPIYHITVDSVPILEQAFEQAKTTKHYFTWAKFAAKEMKKFGKDFQHIKSIYGAVDGKDFSPISEEERRKYRAKFGIKNNTIVIGMVGRNQLRKEYGNLLIALSEYKKDNPSADIKLHFHTSWSEKGNGWDLEKLISYYGLKREDILCTYVCKNCGEWTVESYKGEDINCPICGTEKSKITCNIVNGVPNEEMKYLYGIWDAGINVHTSGGQEYNCVNTLLCGLPLGVTNYASGEDFCEQPFVTPIHFERRFEAHTSFLKASNSIKSIKNFYDKISKMSVTKRKEIGMQGYEWAKKTFLIDTIGPQWENILDSLPEVNWDGFDFDVEQKNSGWALPPNFNEMPEDDFILSLYQNILKAEKADDMGFKNWKTQLKNGISREQIYHYFIKIAHDDNQKSKKVDFWDVLDRDRPNKRAIMVIKESLGDCLMVSQLFESFHEQYPQTDLYIACDFKFANIFDGNPYVYKVLSYQPFMEQEMICIGAGQDKKDAYFDIYFHPGILSQRQLQYLKINNISYDLNK